MPYATVMVYVDADEARERRVRLAVGLADKFNATLIGMSALAIRPAFMAEGAVVQDLMEADIKELRGKLAGTGSWFRITAGADHRKLEWRAVLDFPNHALACESRSADLVLIGQTAAPAMPTGRSIPAGPFSRSAARR
jgi:hypothetical protein